MSQQGFFKRPWQSARPAALESFQKEWEALAARISAPIGGRPDHARLHLFQLSAELDAFLRRWTPVAEAQPRLQSAYQSMAQLLQDARAVFEGSERQRVEQQRVADQRRWESQLEQQRQAEHQARLRQTQQETQAIYEGIRNNQRAAQERQHANWMASNFPETTCACGRAKMANHLFCWDCAPGRRTSW